MRTCQLSEESSMPMAGPLFLGFDAEVVVVHADQAEHEGGDRAEDPRREDAEEDPVGHAGDHAELRGRLVVDVAEGGAVADAPDQRDGPDEERERRLPAGVAQQTTCGFGVGHGGALRATRYYAGV